MKLSRFGFNVFVLVWLAPLTLLDIVNNSSSTGAMSDVYFIKVMVDIILVAAAILSAYFGGKTASRSKAERLVEATEGEGANVVSFENVNSFEPYYCACLALYALVSLWILHDVNKNSTGVVSLMSLFWSITSVGIAILSAVQFYNLKSGAIVKLKEKMTQQ